MKAREIKKALVNRHQDYTANYIGIQVKNSTTLKLLRAQIEELEDVLDTYFGVTKSFFTETTRVEDDVPF